MALEFKVSLPGANPIFIEVDQDRFVVGSLTSNQLTIRGEGVEPIHALIEKKEDGAWQVTDLGAEVGVLVNGAKVAVEQPLAFGDSIKLGAAEIVLQEKRETAVDLPPPPIVERGAAPAGSPDAQPAAAARQKIPQRRRKADLLFSPRFAKPTGRVLEVVAYWGESVLDIEHFSPRIEGKRQVTVGDPQHADFIAVGPRSISKHVVATVSDSGYTLRLASGMTGRLRTSKGAKNVADGKYRMGRDDIAHLTYGPIRYFFIFTSPPSLRMPKRGIRDPFFTTILAAFFLFYACFMAFVAISEVPEKDDFEDDLWSIVHVPEKKKPVKKPETRIAVVKKKPPPRPTPPKPKPKPVKPVQAKAVTKKPVKPRPPKPVVKKPVKRPHQTLTAAKTQAPRRKVAAAPSKPKAKAPAPSRRPRGGGGGKKNAAGGVRKGKAKSSVKGVAGVKNNKASGVNLAKLGLGVGAIKSADGAGAIRTNFKSSAGGAGGGSGSGAKTYGLGGLGTGSTLALAGSGGSKSWGSGGSVVGKGSGLGKSFGGRRSAAKVNVQAGDPLVSGGLNGQDIVLVIRKNLNPIRHCYDRLLQRSPNSGGKIKVRFVVAQDGRVSSASVVSSTISDATMKSCVASQVRRWKFPRPRGGSSVTVNYPFAFNPP